MQAELCFYVRISIPSEYQSDEKYESTMAFVKEKIDELAEGLEGTVDDLEIK